MIAIAVPYRDGLRRNERQERGGHEKENASRSQIDMVTRGARIQVEEGLHNGHQSTESQGHALYAQYPFEIGGNTVLVKVVEDPPGHKKGKGWHYAEVFINGRKVFNGEWDRSLISEELIAEIDARTGRAHAMFAGENPPLVDIEESEV